MSAPLPPGWTAYQTPDGRWYFHNSVSNVTQWHPPAPPGAHGPPSPGGFHPPGPHGPPPGMMPPPHMQGPPPYGMPPGPGMPPPGASSGMPPPGGPPHGMPPPAAASSAPRPVSGPGPSSQTGFTYPHAVEYKLKEKAFSLSGDSFQVKNTSTNETAFKIKGNALSLRDSKKLLDPSGNAIFQMTESLLTLRGRMQIVDMHSKKPLVTLRKKGFISGFGGGTVQIWRGSTDDGEPWLQVKGDWFKKDFNITEVATQRCLASVRRKSFNLSNIVLEKDTYVLRVEPGVDNALMVFLVVALDELYRDDGKRTGYGSRFSDIAGIF